MWEWGIPVCDVAFGLRQILMIPMWLLLRYHVIAVVVLMIIIYVWVAGFGSGVRAVGLSRFKLSGAM